MTYAKEIVGEWCEVEIPSFLRVFDCRSDNPLKELSPWGSTLYGSERAEMDLGLRGMIEGEKYPFNYATTPLSCSTYTDARTCHVGELMRQITDMVKEATKFYQEWEEAGKNLAPEGQGGSCLYRPIAVALSNFGWSIIGDIRTCRVRRFG